MSLTTYNQSILAASRNLKKFVRETTDSETREPDVKIKKRELNFDGNEAKIVYEGIVSDTPSTSGRRSPKCPSKSRERNRHKSRERRKHVAKVTANSVLKAVENGDRQYLEENITPLNVDICDDYGWTPLMSAAFCGNYEIVDFLLKLGANTQCRDKSGFTAAGFAAKKNHSGIIALLKEKQIAPDSGMFTKKQNPRKDPEETARRSRFYCSICRETFRETTVEKHESSTLHIFNTKPKLPGSNYVIPRGNRGYQIMLNKGWREDGLGPDGSGLKYPVKTILKRDRRGLGQDRREIPRVTHFNSGDRRAVESVRRRPRERTLRKRDRKILLGREARKEREYRKALS